MNESKEEGKILLIWWQTPALTECVVNMCIVYRSQITTSDRGGSVSAILRPIAQIIEYYPRCIRLVWDAAGPHAILAIGVSILGAVVPAAQVWITKIVIDSVVSAVGDGGGAAVDWVGLLIPVAGVFGVWILGSICSAAANGLLEKVGYLVGNHSQYLILRKAAQLDIAFFENSAFFDEMEKARSETYRTQNLAVLSLLIVSSLTGLTAMLAVLLSVHWAAPIILLVTAAPQVIVGGHYAGKRFSLVGAMASNRRMAEYLSRLLGSREAVKEIRIFALHEELLRRFSSFWGLFGKQTFRLRFAQERFGFLLGLITMMGTASIWAYAVVRAVGGHISVGTVALAFQAAEQGRSGFSNLFSNLGLFYEHTIFAGILFRFLDLDPRSVEGALAPPPASPVPVPDRLTQDIEFRNVSFRYPGSDKYVLKNVSFTISVRKSVAIVGENGAGKTTVVKLLARFYDPTEGAIYLEGRDLREYDLASLRRQIGVIFQDFVRYDLSAKENVGFGQVDLLDDADRIERAAYEGGASDLIKGLSKGYDTILGKEFDEGVDLSGGEWQKIALSRAFMKEAEVLILDEPTAALDAFAERDVFSRFAELTSDRTAIFISHRFSTVRMADHILVLQQGELVEQGSHEQLVAEDGRYAQMFNTQAKQYR